MKTMILFSSIFYLLGLKLGGTLQVFRHMVSPVKSIVSVPEEKAEESGNDGKTFFFSGEKTVTDKGVVKNDTTRINGGSASPATPEKPGDR